MNYECRIPTIEEVNERWKFLVDSHEEDKMNWEKWRKEALYNFGNGNFIIYYGFLDGKVICEATAIVKSLKEDEFTRELIGEKKAYLSAFRTNKEYEGQGYFSKLYKYMLNDLKNKGYEEVSLGVEPEEERNKAIYSHFGFNEFIKETHEVYPNGEEVTVDYYKMKL